MQFARRSELYLLKQWFTMSKLSLASFRSQRSIYMYLMLLLKAGVSRRKKETASSCVQRQGFNGQKNDKVSTLEQYIKRE
jgi:hypothetical protein